MKTYRDKETGFDIRVLTDTESWSTKPYFDFECTTVNDELAFVSENSEGKRNLWFVNIETGEKDLFLELGSGDRFSVPLNREYGLLFKGETKGIYRCDLTSGEQSQLGEVPFCLSATSGQTTFQDGTLVASYQHRKKYYFIGVTDLKTGKCEMVYRTDQWTNHTQACPTDNENILYVHETGGDAVQRMWMFNYREGSNRPYFVEQENDWITHELWSRSGESVMFCRLFSAARISDEPDELWIGHKDGQRFKCVAKGSYLHGAPDASDKWIVADDSRTGWITLVDLETGENIVLATGLFPSSGAAHCHPSFNRRGDQVILTLPFSDENVQAGVIDLKQVDAWAKKQLT